MQFEQFIASITPEIYANMKQAVETGRWPDGRNLSEEEQEMTLRAVIAYDHKMLAEQDRIGHIDDQCKSKDSANEIINPLKWS